MTSEHHDQVHNCIRQCARQFNFGVYESACSQIWPTYLESELNAAFFICFFYLSGWVWWCELLNSYLSGWVWWCELLDMLNLPKPIVSFLYALFAQPQGFWSGCTMLERLCILLDEKLRVAGVKSRLAHGFQAYWALMCYVTVRSGVTYVCKVWYATHGWPRPLSNKQLS